MHSLLCTTALHLYFVGKGSFVSVDYHRAQAIADINANLSDPTRRVSDENIAAVFNLLCVEESLETLPALKRRHKSGSDMSQRLIHLNGLKQMVDLRGGLGNLRSNRCLEAFILW
jgi:hypothetical protein